jgi:paraquat-inducible protein B
MVKKISMLLLVAFVFLGCKETGLNLKVRYDQIQGLNEGDRVIFEQNHIGQVAGIFYSEEGYYLVDVVIRKEFANAATDYSKFLITQDPEKERKKAVEITQSPRGGTLLTDGATVIGTAKASPRSNQQWGDFGKTLDDLKKQLEEFADDLRKIPESEEFKKLEKELERLLEEMKKSGDATREKIEKEVLPRIKREIEKLKERLRGLGREEEVKPLEVRIEKLRKL